MMMHPPEGASPKSTDAEGMQKGCRFATRQKIAKGKLHNEHIKITKGKIEKGNFGKC